MASSITDLKQIFLKIIIISFAPIAEYGQSNEPLAHVSDRLHVADQYFNILKFCWLIT